MSRDRYYLPYAERLLNMSPLSGADTVAEHGISIEMIDYYMSALCGVRQGRTKEAIYRTLGWLAQSANMGDVSGGVPHDASTGSATDSD